MNRLTGDLYADNMTNKQRRLEQRIAALERRLVQYSNQAAMQSGYPIVPESREVSADVRGYWVLSVEYINGIPMLVGTRYATTDAANQAGLELNNGNNLG